MTDAISSPSSDDVIARAGTYYRNARYILVVLILGAGIAFAYDGFVRYPNDRDKFERATESEQSQMTKPHSDLDITIQRTLAFSLLPLSGFLLAFFLYRSRGEYRLAGSTLSIPGHPPVPLDCILGIDKSKWDRKGIAYIDYEIAGSKPRRLTLDDFIYQRGPTDKIVERIEAYVTPADASPAPQADDTSPGDGFTPST